MATVRSGKWVAEAIAAAVAGTVAILFAGLVFHQWTLGVVVAISSLVTAAVNDRRKQVQRRSGARKRVTSAGTTPR
jgi:hypothetical protein